LKSYENISLERQLLFKKGGTFTKECLINGNKTLIKNNTKKSPIYYQKVKKDFLGLSKGSLFSNEDDMRSKINYPQSKRDSQLFKKADEEMKVLSKLLEFCMVRDLVDIFVSYEKIRAGEQGDLTKAQLNEENFETISTNSIDTNNSTDKKNFNNYSVYSFLNNNNDKRTLKSSASKILVDHFMKLIISQGKSIFSHITLNQSLLRNAKNFTKWSLKRGFTNKGKSWPYSYRVACKLFKFRSFKSSKLKTSFTNRGFFG
jgi:hypothetical protein